MKLIKRLLIILIVIILILGILAVIGYKKVHVEMDESDLPTTVYEEDSDLLNIVNNRLIALFVLSAENEYTIIEEVVNLIILDTIRENVNTEYDPLTDCETIECNYIIHNKNYYVNYTWAELNDDNQLVVHVSVGSDRLIGINTIVDFYMDIEIDYSEFSIALTLDKLAMNEMEMTTDTLDKLLSYFDKDTIESSVTEGELDMETYKFTLSLPIIP